MSTPAMLSLRSQAACISSFVFERRALVTAGSAPHTRALIAWEASLRDVRDKSHDNLLKIVDDGAKL